MEKIKDQLQEQENESTDGYQLKSNEEIIHVIAEFGNGETEFHTVDIERLIVENVQVREMMVELEKIKTEKEYEPGSGFEVGIQRVLNKLNEIF